MLVDGQRTAAIGYAQLDVYNPAEEKCIATLPAGEQQDIDPAVHAADAAASIFSNFGQACCAGSRLKVHMKNFDRVASDPSVLAGKRKVGSGLDSSTELGPLVLRAQIDLEIS